ncbi:MAG: alpha/beta-type small acid-soluble spore protein [Oscillospiraceae bacterium]|nr:alpha/beta-type small acid-soluble spore protein [Oscillospiraceae bacterium]
MAKSGSSKGMVPEAREALDRFKMEAASEVGVNLKQGYNGDLTSREAGSVGGQMVKKICPIRPPKNIKFNRDNRTANGHQIEIEYLVGVCI